MPETVVDSTPKSADKRILRDGNVLLFRYENPEVSSSTFHPDLVGHWFTDNPDSLKTYILMRPPGGNIIIISVPESKMDELHVANNSTAKEMDAETDNDNYIVPDELLTNARKIKFDVQSSGSNKFKLADAEKINTFIDELLESEEAKEV